MPDLGKLALAIALILAVYSIAANIYGARRNAPDFVVSARHAIWAMCAMVTIAVFVLWPSLLHSDFSLEYVASYSSTTLPTHLQDHFAMGRPAGLAAVLDAGC